MARAQKTGNIAFPLIMTVLWGVGAYFAFAAVQGDYGVFRRIQVSAEKQALIEERARLQAEVSRLENLTRRLSDRYLDLDLLDERARDVLGYVRADEIVIQ
ncbi:septum formation initiator [Albidovulum inexpectatum]|uniref:Septum formation initiator n=1 Tax=Albidovulum inexpectatum TaxID=196587 RepID=A0A2S5JIF0_9RHOB|nr:septum formation initiator family protein [Albidovulum inexpectatum]PPB81316.1 septum formation initiator [Albidovulum inexpectatum]